MSRVSRLCPIFRAQPGAYPPEAKKRTLRRRAGALAENAHIGKNGSGKSRLRQMQENAENGQNRGILDAAARKQPAMDLSRDKNAEEMKWSPLEMGAAMQAHGA